MSSGDFALKDNGTFIINSNGKFAINDGSGCNSCDTTYDYDRITAGPGGGLIILHDGGSVTITLHAKPTTMEADGTTNYTITYRVTNTGASDYVWAGTPGINLGVQGWSTGSCPINNGTHKFEIVSSSPSGATETSGESSAVNASWSSANVPAGGYVEYSLTFKCNFWQETCECGSGTPQPEYEIMSEFQFDRNLDARSFWTCEACP